MLPHLKDNLTPRALELIEALESLAHDILEELDGSDASEAVYVGVGAHIAKYALDQFYSVETTDDE